MNQPLEIYEIPIDNAKSIYTMPAPIKGANKVFFAQELKNLGIGNVVSLLSNSEILIHGLNKEKEVYKAHQIKYLNFPVTDFGTPKDFDGFKNLVFALANKLKNGEKIAIHCKAGIGRSSLLAAAILIHFGHNPKDVFPLISKYRGLNVPDKQSQIDWLKTHESMFV